MENRELRMENGKWRIKNYDVLCCLLSATEVIFVIFHHALRSVSALCSSPKNAS